MNEMCWMGIGGSEHTEKILHLKINGAWKPYHSCKSYAVADYGVPRESKGYATMQHLLKKGWQLVSTAEVSNNQVSYSILREVKKAKQ